MILIVVTFKPSGVHLKVVHLKEKPHSCNYPTCEKKFGYVSLLRDHIRKAHVEEIEEEFLQA